MGMVAVDVAESILEDLSERSRLRFLRGLVVARESVAHHLSLKFCMSMMSPQVLRLGWWRPREVSRHIGLVEESSLVL
jgi:hypothetical protein